MSAAKRRRRTERTAEDIIKLILEDFEDPRKAYFTHRAREDYVEDFGGELEPVFSAKILGGPGKKFRPGEDEKLAEYFAENEVSETITVEDFLKEGPPRLTAEEEEGTDERVGAAKVDIIRAGFSALLQNGTVHIDVLRAAHELAAGVEPHLPVQLIDHVQTTGEVDDHTERLLLFLGANPYEDDSDDESSDDDFIDDEEESTDGE